MIAVFDANMLIWLFDDKVERSPVDPATGGQTTDCKARVENLLTALSAKHAQVVIPAPALAEALVYIDRAKQGQIFAILRKSSVIRVEPFGDVAAAECAELLRKRLGAGPLGDGSPGNRQLVKFDLQIVAIANVVRANVIYSSDPGVKKLALESGRQVVSIWELEVPTSLSQGRMFVDEEREPAAV